MRRLSRRTELRVRIAHNLRHRHKPPLVPRVGTAVDFALLQRHYDLPSSDILAPVWQ